MKLLTYEVDRRKDIGVMSKDEMWVYPLRAFGMEYTSMMEVVKGFSQSEKDLLEHVSGLEPYGITGAAMRSEVRILAPIEAPEQDRPDLRRKHLTECGRKRSISPRG